MRTEDIDYLPRRELALAFARLLLGLLVVATVGRPLLVELDPLFTYAGIGNIGLALVVLWLIHTQRLPGREGELVIGLGMLCILPLLLVSGGVSSQFAFLIPIYPLGAIMLGGRRLGLITCVVWLLLIIGLTVAAPRLTDLTGDTYHHGKTVARGIWAVLGVIMATAIGVYFNELIQRMAERLRAEATTDHLTGLANRRALEAALDAELARLQRSGGALSVMMLDVDRFKAFNDAHGHAAGDRCLRAIAQCLAGSTRAGQDLVGRHGGEEFVVLLTHTDAPRALAVAEKLRAAVAGTTLDAVDAQVTVTIGIATAVAADRVTRETLLQLADRALYAGKTAGRNRVVHADSLLDAA